MSRFKENDLVRNVATDATGVVLMAGSATVTVISQDKVDVWLTPHCEPLEEPLYPEWLVTSWRAMRDLLEVGADVITQLGICDDSAKLVMQYRKRGDTLGKLIDIVDGKAEWSDFTGEETREIVVAAARFDASYEI
jgi:hypothetical protein